MIFHANRYDNKAGVVKFMSDNIEFKTKTVRQDRRDHFLFIILISLCNNDNSQEDITCININPPNIGEPEYVKHITDIEKKDNNNSSEL